MPNVTNGLELAGRLRGIVEDNKDPKKLGRLKIRVQSAYGQQPKDKLPWAWPAWIHGGTERTGFFDVPEEGAVVWVEFLWKDGKPDTTYPIWSGTWLGEEKPGRADTPEEIKDAPDDPEKPYKDAHLYKTFRTNAMHLLYFIDKEEEERVELRHGMKRQFLAFDKDGNAVLRTRGGWTPNPKELEKKPESEPRLEGGHVLELIDSEEEQRVTLRHSGGAEVTMDKDGRVFLTAPSSITISAPSVIISGDVSCPGKCNC